MLRRYTTIEMITFLNLFDLNLNLLMLYINKFSNLRLFVKDSYNKYCLAIFKKKKTACP